MKRKRSAALPPAPQIRTSEDSVAQDDARIATLEKKLGIKGRKSVPKSFQDDGLEDLFGIGLEVDDEIDDRGGKRATNREYDEFLAEKRGLKGTVADNDEDMFSEDAESEFNGFSSSEDAGDAMEDDSDKELERPKRENPYVAPVDGARTTYLPPQRRGLASATDGSARVQKEIKGLVNRINADNLGSIIKDLEKLYHGLPRGDVTEAIVQAVLEHVNNPFVSRDTFFIDIAGFVAGLYRVVGESFASAAVTRIVQEFRDEYVKAKAATTIHNATTLVALLSELYMFDVVRCNLIFDLVRLLLDKLSELNTELLLQITKVAGKKLVKEDPKALEEISAQLRSFVHSADKGTVSERTKFMVETISNLRSRRVDREESEFVKERVSSMKKLLTTLGSRISSVRPLPIGLKDIEHMRTTGKWWLVGASFAGNADQDKHTQIPAHSSFDEDGSDPEDEDLDLFFPDYAKAARQQGLETATEQAIFVAIAAAQNLADACQRYRRLRLNKHSKREVAFVLFQMAGAEQPYNPFYADVAERVCDTKQMMFTFQAGLWRIFRSLGVGIFEGESNEEDEDGVRYDEARVSNIGRFAGSLVARSILSVNALKCLDLMGLKKEASRLVTHMLLRTIRECVKGAKGDEYMRKVERVFGQVVDDPVLAAGLHYFLSKKVVRTKVDWIKKEQIPGIKAGCEHAQRVLAKEVNVL